MVSSLLDWIPTIFESNSDKARLIAIVISSIVAVSILLLNQRLISGRDRKKLLIEKIEDTSKLISKFDRGASKFLFSDSEDNAQHLSEAIEALDEMEMLLNLYFPYNVFANCSEVHNRVLGMKNSMADVEDSAGSAEVIENAKVGHRDNIIFLRKECRNLMKKYGHKMV
jgi:hypothetical protein